MLANEKCCKRRAGSKHEYSLIKTNVGRILIQQCMSNALFVTCVTV